MSIKMIHIKELALMCLLLICCSLSHGLKGKNVPRGHMQELGLHRDPDGHVDIVEGPYSALDFWSNYVSKRRPVLIKGAANNFPAKSLWTDDYLSNEFGQYNVKLEKKKESQGIPVGDLGLGRDSIKNFISTYVQDNKYIVSQLPSPMYRDLLVPSCLSCGSFADSLVEVNYWMSSGGTKSMLHKDAPNILNCLLNGTKNWLLISPKHEYLVPLAKEPTMDGGGYSVLQVDKVDLLQFSKFKDCPYRYANVTAGDCLYVPYGALHHVRSFGEKNMAISFLFSRSKTHLKTFNNQGCEQPASKKLTDLQVAWDFDGLGSLTMGLQEPTHYKETVLRIFKSKNVTSYPAKSLLKKLIREYLNVESMGKEKYREGIQLIVDNFNLANKSVITVDDIKALPLQSWRNVIAFLEMDPANTLQYEYKALSRSDVQTVITYSTDKSGQLDSNKFLTAYMERAGGSAKVAKEILQAFDTDGDGSISKEETQKNHDKVLELFDAEIPEEHINSYSETYVYRAERPEVAEIDEMSPDYNERLNNREEDVTGFSVKKGYAVFEADNGKHEDRPRPQESDEEEDDETNTDDREDEDDEQADEDAQNEQDDEDEENEREQNADKAKKTTRDEL